MAKIILFLCLISLCCSLEIPVFAENPILEAINPDAEKIYYEELLKEYIPQPTPEEAFKLELTLMADGMYVYDLPLFDPKWRQKGSQILTDSIFKESAQAFDHPFKTFIEDNRAVIYFPDRHDLGPVFLYQNEQGWVIDRTVIDQSVFYDYKVQWAILDKDNPYIPLLKQVYPLKEIDMLEKGAQGYQVDFAVMKMKTEESQNP